MASRFHAFRVGVHHDKYDEQLTCGLCGRKYGQKRKDRPDYEPFCHDCRPQARALGWAELRPSWNAGLKGEDLEARFERDPREEQ